MMSTMDDLKDGIVGVKAHGKVTREDYETVLMPAVERALQGREKIRLLYRVAPDFTSFTGGAMWDDAKLGMRHMRAWERVAVVTDVAWIVDAVKFFQFVIPATTRVFRYEELEQAKEWLAGQGS
jgi:hypothetical protein